MKRENTVAMLVHRVETGNSCSIHVCTGCGHPSVYQSSAVTFDPQLEKHSEQHIMSTTVQQSLHT